MSFRAIIDVKELRRGMDVVLPIVARTATAPILRNALLAFKDGRLSITTSDQAQEVCVLIDAEGEGSATVEAARLDALAKKLPDGAQISLAEDGKSLEIKSGRSRHSFPTLPASDFPLFASAEQGASFEVSAFDLSAIIAGVSYAQADDERAQYHLTATYLHVVGDKLRAVGTDGAALAIRDAALPDGARNVEGTLISRRAAGTLGRVLKGAETVNFTKLPNRIILTSRDITFSTLLVSSPYVDYPRAVPSMDGEEGTDLIFEVQDLVRALDLALIVQEKHNSSVTLRAQDRSIIVSLADANGGEADQEMEAEVRGSAVSMKLGSRLLRDLLSACTFDTARMRVKPDRISVVSAAASGTYPEQHILMARAR